MLSRRLLISGIGGGTFTPPGPESSTLTSDPHGGWTQIPDPKGFAITGATVLGWVNADDGSIEVGTYDHATDTMSSPTTLATGLADEGPTDNHNSGSIMPRVEDGKLVAAYAGHVDTRVRVRVSTNAGDTSSWATEQVLNPGYGGVYTYCTLVQLRGVSGEPIYLFARSIPNLGSQTGRLVYAKSTDGGDSWGSWTVLFTGASLDVPYWRIGSDWDTRIDVFTTDEQPAASTGLWHFYIDGTDDSRHLADGTTISAALPLDTGDLGLVLDDTDGSLWSWGASWDGAPATVIMQEVGASDNRILTARWRSGAWQVDEVVASVGGQLGINKYGSGAAIHHTDPDIVFVAIKATKFEMWRYTSSDDGATWNGTAVTTGSASDNVWPEVIHEQTAALEAVWLYGDYTNDTSFVFGIRGYGL